MVHVQAFDQKSGAREAITIVNSDGLSDKELLEIKSRLDNNSEPEIHRTKQPKNSKSASSLEAQIRGDLSKLQHLLDAHEQRLAEKTRSSISNFKSQVQQLLEQNNEQTYSAVSTKLTKLLNDLTQQLVP